MPYQIQSVEVPSTDSVHTLRGVLFLPTGKIKGIFHLVHGMCEYIGRYESLFSFLADRGYICCGYDHLGHGKTAQSEEELGFIAHKDGWKYLVKDVTAFEKAILERFPDQPLFLMGHSMGSFIVRLAVENGAFPDKLILCGTGGPNPASPVGLLATDVIRLWKGEHHRSKFINRIAFGAYNKRFEGKSDYEWLTNDHDVIDRYENDPYCRYLFTVSAMHDLIKLNARCNRAAWFQSFPENLPVLLIAGADDPVGNYGKGVSAVYHKLVSERKNALLKLYDNCRHEIHNDTCKAQMLSDLLQFLECGKIDK